MKFFIAGVLFLVLFIISSFQSKMPDMGETITWSPTKLTWDDFKKKISGNTIEAACTVWGIYISNHPKQVSDTFYFDVHAFFSKTLSAKNTKKESLTDNVLTHEQKHFDITEVYARMLRKDLEEAKFKNVTDFYKSVQLMYNKESSACNKEQAEYDNETKHSMNIDEQEKWNKKVAEELEKYKAYTDTQLKIVVK